MHDFPLITAQTSHADAIAFDDGSRPVSYRELWGKVADARSRMAAAGIGRGARVCWSPENDLESLVFFWSLFSMGAIACPIQGRFSVAQREAVVKQLDAHWVSRPELEELVHRAGRSDRAWGETVESFDGKAPATIILSSGSTGIPKAVVHSLDAHMANAAGSATNVTLQAGDRWLWSLPAYHVSGFSILVRCAMAGAAVCVAERFAAGTIRASRATHLSVVGTQLRRLLSEREFPSPDVRAVLVGGGTIPNTLLEAAKARGVPICTTYGLTEMASQVATSSLLDSNVSAPRVLPHCELEIDETGEILVRGASLCLGYWKAGSRHHVVDRKGWFHTGDLGLLDAEGAVSVVGRTDNMFISGGENIHPESIERVLLDFPGVDMAVVVPRPDEVFGARPIAFVRMLPGFAPMDRSALRDRLAGFEIPDAILPWPDGADLGIKPNRARLCDIASGQ